MSSGILQNYRKGTTFTSTVEGNNVMLVKSGYVKRYSITRDGSLAVQIVYGPEDVFSFTKIFNELFALSLHDGPQVFYYETMCAAEIYSLPLKSLETACLAEPLLYQNLLSEAGRHLKSCVHTIENIGMKSAYARVAHQILYLAHNYGQPGEYNVPIDIPITHQDIADILGITRATASLAINKLRHNGLLKEDRNLIVTDISRLTDEIYN